MSRSIASLLGKKSEPQIFSNNDLPRDGLLEKSSNISGIDNTTRIDRPLIRPSTQTFDNKNGLAAFVEQLKEKLIKKFKNPIDEDIYYSDTPHMIQIQSKFNATYESWLKFMNVLQTLATELDTKYESKNYLGYKSQLIMEFLNIAISFFIIGIESKYGSGIDNRHGPGPIIFDVHNPLKPTVKMSIESYFEAIIPTFEKIAENQKFVLAIDSQYEMHKRQLDAINSNIGTCEGSIAKQTKNLEKFTEENEIQMTKNSISQIKQTLKGYLDKKKILDDKINKFINDKKVIQNSIHKDHKSLSDLLCFNYFLHEDYYAGLDSGILGRRIFHLYPQPFLKYSKGNQVKEYLIYTYSH